jgi:hypothetical protein|tara:strand:+ start:2242 stop:2403 length:162 start_codon:yes stop_codon:yes gene_type:complete
MKKKIKPQVLTALLTIFFIAVLVIILTPQYIDKIVAGALTGIGMLGMKLLEKE